MVDISGKTTKLPQATFINMRKRVIKWISDNKKNPEKVFINKGGEDYISYKKFEEMNARFESWKSKYGKYPDNIYVNKPKGTQKVVVATKEWYNSVKYKFLKQRTGYTCGPASIANLAYEFDIIVDEATVAKWAGTGLNGTSHEGMLNALNKLGLQGKFVYFAKVSLNEMGLIAEEPKRGIIFHTQVRDKGTAYDYLRKLIYKSYRKGHYIEMYGVNILKKLIKVQDPDRGIVTYLYDQVKYSCEATETLQNKGSVLIVTKS